MILRILLAIHNDACSLPNIPSRAQIPIYCDSRRRVRYCSDTALYHALKATGFTPCEAPFHSRVKHDAKYDSNQGGSLEAIRMRARDR